MQAGKVIQTLPPKPIQAGSQGTRKPTILIVDDERHWRELLAEYIQDEGFDVTTAEGIKDALEQFQINSPDIVLTDLFMGKERGDELATQIKKISPNTPVIVHSSTPEEVREEHIQSTFCIIGKGDSNGLLEKINLALKK